MLRHDRTRFVAFGVASLANTAALLIYGLGLATHGRGGAAASLPVLIVLAGLILLICIWAAIKRGRDLGWSAWITAAACVVAFGMGPVVLVLAGYLSFAKGTPADNKYGSPPSPPAFATWFWALLLVAFPWIALAVAARVLA